MPTPPVLPPVDTGGDGPRPKVAPPPGAAVDEAIRRHLEFLDAFAVVAERHQRFLEGFSGNLEPARSIDPPLPQRPDLESLAHGDVACLGDVPPETGNGLRLPAPPLLLVDRVIRMERDASEPLAGRVVTEYRVPAEAWDLPGGHLSPGLLLEAGQGHMVLLAWLGYGRYCTDGRKYRFLGAEGEMVGPPPTSGDILVFDIRVGRPLVYGAFAGVTVEGECRVDGRVCYRFRKGRGGFFPGASLTETREAAGLPEAGPPPTPLRPHCTNLDSRQVAACLDGRLMDAFGSGFSITTPQSSLVPDPRLRAVDGLESIDPAGRLVATMGVKESDWFFSCHFVDDPAMPGHRFLEMGLQTLAILLRVCGRADPAPETGYGLIPEVAFDLRFTGQVGPATGAVTCRLQVRELFASPSPGAVADMVFQADGVTVAIARNLSCRLAPRAPAPLPTTPLRTDGRHDPQAFWPHWRARLGMGGPWPGEDLFGALCRRCLDRILIEDAEGFAALGAKPRLYLANHQVAVESVIFGMALTALSGSLVRSVAKEAHQDTWVGEMFGHVYTHPDVRPPALVFYRDEYDPASMVKLLKEIEPAMEKMGESLLIHTKAARVVSCHEPLTVLSTTFVDLALRLDIPIVPVRFVGGVPVEPMDDFRDFPIGFARQDFHLGRVIRPEALRRLTGEARRRLILDRINGLGPEVGLETPNPPDPVFYRRVGEFMTATGTTQAKAVLLTCLAEHANACERTGKLVAAMESGRLDLPDTAEDRWFAALCRWLTDGRLSIRFEK